MADDVTADPSPAPAEPLADPTPGAPATGTEYGPNPAAVPGVYAPVDYAKPLPNKVWTVGTLSYTTAGLMTLFAVLLGGDFALSMRERSIGPTVQQMIKRLTPSDLVMALLVSTLPTALTLLILPVVSYKSDRHRGRWGRRIPYVLIPAPFAAVAMALVAFSEPLGRWLHGTLGRGTDSSWGLACFGASWTVFESVALITVPMVGALVNDVVPRPVLGRFYGLFRAISLIAGILWFYWVYQYTAAHSQILLITIAVIFGVGMTAMCLAVREGEYPPPPPAHAGGSVARLYAASIHDLGDAFAVGYYRWIFAALTLAALAFLPVNMFSIPYSQAIEMPDAIYGKLVALTYVCSLVLAWPLGWLVDKAHSLRLSLLTMAIYGVAMLLAGVMIHDVRSLGFFFIVHGVLSGCYFTVSAPLGQVLFPRLNYARYAAGATLVQSVVTLGFGPLLGQSLNWSGHAYRLTYIFGGGIAAVAAVCLLAVYVQFNRLGGVRGYVAPGETESAARQGFEIARPGH